MTSPGIALLLAIAAALLAAATYFRGGPPTRALAPAVVGRSLAWGVAALLLLNPSCPSPDRGAAPLVLLDDSPSMEAPGARRADAAARAEALGEVRRFGGSRLLPALIAVAASGRPIVIVTDGEIADAGAVSPALLAGTTVELLPRVPVPDLAIVGVEGPRHLARGDSLVIRAAIRAVGGGAAAPTPVELVAGDQVLTTRPMPPMVDGSAEVILEAGGVALPPGDHLLEVRLAGAGDAEPRTDRRLHLLTVSATPGIVLVAGRASWEARFLFHTLRALAALPVQGYQMLEPGNWRRMSDLGAVPAAAVRGAVQAADLLVTLGPPPAEAGTGRSRGRWEWLDDDGAEGDWYLAGNGVSPIASAFAAISADSLPPATSLAPITPSPGAWIGASAQLGRRGGARPAIVGWEEGGRRRMTVAAGGLWRWAFRGGAAEQAYRSWVASSVSWLLGAAGERAGGVAVPVRPVVERGESLVFARTGGEAVASLPVTLEGNDGARVDTLVFDADGRARIGLEPGRWQYRFDDGSSGTVAVEEYSSEFLPGPVTLAAREAAVSSSTRGQGARELPWLFALAIAGWCVEWGARRRVGMR